MVLTRIRLQPAIYFCLHAGSLRENTAGRQPRFLSKPRAGDFRKKTICQLNPPHLFVMYTLQPRFWELRIQIARSESEKAEEDRDQATKEQRYTKRNATPRRVFW